MVSKLIETEYGVIPDDWTSMPISEMILDIADGPFGSNLKAEHYTEEHEARIVQLSNIGEDGWKEENTKYDIIYSDIEYKNSKGEFLICQI